jgi:peptidoglycan/LPS O-acetylase OafA/YrhL
VTAARECIYQGENLCIVPNRENQARFPADLGGYVFDSCCPALSLHLTFLASSRTGSGFRIAALQSRYRSVYPECNHRAPRLLNTPAMVWIGNLSYSLYLWNMPFTNPRVHSWATAFPQNVILTFVAATISFYAVEQPIRRAREAPRPVAQPGSALDPGELPKEAAVGTPATVSAGAIFGTTTLVTFPL